MQYSIFFLTRNISITVYFKALNSQINQLVLLLPGIYLLPIEQRWSGLRNLPQILPYMRNKTGTLTMSQVCRLLHSFTDQLWKSLTFYLELSKNALSNNKFDERINKILNTNFKSIMKTTLYFAHLVLHFSKEMRRNQDITNCCNRNFTFWSSCKKDKSDNFPLQAESVGLRKIYLHNNIPFKCEYPVIKGMDEILPKNKKLN